MKHVVSAFTMTLFPGRGRPERDATGATPTRVVLTDGGLELSMAGLAYRTANTVEALARALRARLATPAPRRGLTPGLRPLAGRRAC